MNTEFLPKKSYAEIYNEEFIKQIAGNSSATENAINDSIQAALTAIPEIGPELVEVYMEDVRPIVNGIFRNLGQILSIVTADSPTDFVVGVVAEALAARLVASAIFAPIASPIVTAFTLGVVGIQDSHLFEDVIHTLDGTLRSDRRPMGKDGTALSG
jgi:hypothetical protein